MMNNTVTALAKISLLAGGAVMGALLARLIDDMIVAHSQESPDDDKLRYAQGLSAVPSQPTETTITFVRSEGDEWQTQ